MFHFLSNKKRNYIWSHPSLGKILNSREDVRLFIDNLKAFKSDLLNHSFTEEDIMRIEKYAEGLFSQEIQNLGQKILTEAGFEVFLWAGGRPDLNYWIKEPGYYIRVVHKFRGPFTKYEKFSKEFRGNYVITSGLPFNLLYPAPIQSQFQVNVTIPSKRSKKIQDSDWGLSKDGLKPHPYEMTMQSYDQRMKVHPNHLRCWCLCSKIEYGPPSQRLIRYSQEERKVPIKGIFGKLGIKKRKTVQIPIYQSQFTLKSAELMPLKWIVETNSMENSYLLELYIQKNIRDNENRPGNGFEVYIISTKNLVEEIVTFLFRNPDLFCDLVLYFLPESQYPNLHRAIVEAYSRSEEGSKGIVFLNYTDGEEEVID